MTRSLSSGVDYKLYVFVQGLDNFTMSHVLMQDVGQGHLSYAWARGNREMIFRLMQSLTRIRPRRHLDNDVTSPKPYWTSRP